MKTAGTPTPAQAAAVIEAWRAVAPNGGEVVRIDSLQAKKGKPVVWRLTLQSGRVPSVVAKQARVAEASIEDHIYRNILSGSRLPAPRYFGLVPSGEATTAWVFLEYIDGSEYAADNAIHRKLAADWLADIHSAFAEDGSLAPLEDVGPGRYREILGNLVQTLAGVRGNPAIGRDGLVELERLQHLLTRFAGAWTHIEQLGATFDRTLVHGSFGPINMRVSTTASGPTLLVFDWGAAGRGTPARDVAKLVSSSVGGDLIRYCDRRGLDAEAGRKLVALGSLFRALEHLLWSAPLLAYDWVDGPMATVGRHAHVLQSVADAGVLDLAP